MCKRGRQLCLVFALGLVIGLPGLASVAHADLVGPDFNSYISYAIGPDGGIESLSEGTISYGDSVVTVHPTSMDVISALPNLASAAYLSWRGTGVVKLSFDYTMAIYDGAIYASVSVQQGSGQFSFADFANDSYTGLYHFTGIFNQNS